MAIGGDMAGGRDLLMREGLAKYDQILKRCPELQRLQERIRAHVSGLPVVGSTLG
jgi:hypothetical protein